MIDPTPPFAPPPDARPPDLDRLWQAVRSETVEATPSPSGWLREAPTPLRVLAVAGAGAAVSAVVLGALGLRADLNGAWGQLAPLVGALGVLTLGALRTALRPTSEQPPSPAALALLLGLPWVPALLPGVWPGDHDNHTSGAVVCAVLGLVAAGAVLGSAAWADRSLHLPRWRLVAGAAAGGLAANTMLGLLCPHAHAAHLLLGHAPAGLAVLALGLMATAARARRQAA